MLRVDYTQLEQPQTWQLRLEHYNGQFAVIDTVRLETLARFQDPHAAERFMRAFVARTPGADLDAWSITDCTASVKVPLPSNVYRLRPAEPLDERTA
jgi:hypothetical protein